MSEWFAGAGIAVMGPFPPRPGGVSVQCGLLADLLEEAGARVTRLNTDVPALRSAKMGRGLLPAAQVANLLRHLRRTRARWQILHVHAASWWGFMPAVVGLLGRGQAKRLVVSYHGGEAAAFLDRWGALACAVLRRYDVLLALTPTQSRLFRARGLAVQVTPNIVSVEHLPFHLRERVQPRLLWLRQLEPRYRPADALDVLARVQAQHPSATLTVAGGGSLASALVAETARRGLKGVTFTGQLPPEAVLRAYDAADIFLNTSAIDNLPLTLIEASAAGLPIVSTAAGAIPDLICDGENGLLGPVGDTVTLAGHVLQLLADQELGRRLSQAAHANAGRYAWPQVAPLLAQAYGFN